MRVRWHKWMRDNVNEFPSNEFGAFVRIADTVLDEISEYLTGKL